MLEKFLTLVVALAIGAAGGSVFYFLHAPLPWTLGAILTTAAAAIMNSRFLLKTPARNFVRPVVGVLAVVGGIFYGLANTSGIAYGERQLTAIDFTSLNNDQKRAALVEANADRCTCGCGMTLAQCVATDMTCPVRESNITKIRGMVQRALSSGGSS